MEKGEVAVIGINIVMLLALVLLLNFGAQNSSGIQGPSNIQVAYWGPVNLNYQVPFGQTLVTHSNQSQIFVGFSASPGVVVDAATASRVCHPLSGPGGQVMNYGNLTLQSGSSPGEEYLVISPAIQTPGWQCTYTSTIDLSNKVEFQWTGTIALAQ